MIPRLIHFVWVGGELPEWADRNIREFVRLNPGYEVMLHGEEVLDERYRRRYEAAADLSSRADLLRYSALQKHGGWYWDTDFWPLRSLEDLERAYGLDGSKMFLAEQRGNRNAAHRVGNGILAVERGWPGWTAIDQAIENVGRRPNRTAYGPALMTRVRAVRPDLFTTARPEWFFPFPIGQGAKVYRRMVAEMSGTLPPDALAEATRETGGQLPWCMHLWMGGGRDLDAAAGVVRGAVRGVDGLLMGIISSTRQWDSSQPHRAIADGLARIGCRVEVREYAKNWPLFDERPDAIFIWNGRNSSSLDIVRKAEEEGITVFRMEHGFFDRMAYTQVDHAGILHWASWADCLGLDEPAPPDGAERLSRVWPWPPADFGPRRSGKVLVLGQVPGDSQLQASEVRLPRHLTRIVRDNLSPKFQPVFRPHPRCDRLHLRQVRMPDAAGSLVDAIREARFVVTINSNAGNEALALGCPVLAFGPALYLQAGVARLATQETIAEDLAAMAAGWRPETEKVHEYLRWLACRQWNVAEFSDGEVLRPLLAAAGLAARETPDDENGENSENSVKETDVRVVEHAA